MNISIKPELDKIISYTFAGIVFFLVLISFPQTITHTEAQQELIPQQPAVVFNAFASTTIQAEAAYVYDLKFHKVLFQKNESTPMPLASITKLMTAVTALTEAPTSTIVTISHNSLSEDGDSGLYGDEEWELDNLLKYTLTVSSNDGASAIAEVFGSRATSDSSQSARDVFVQKMNTTASNLGLSQTHFYNPTGLDLDPTKPGATGSAKDVATLLAYAVNKYPAIFKATARQTVTVSSLSNFSHTGTNTNVLAGALSGLIAGKTGYTQLAGGNLAIMTTIDTDHPVIVVVLGSTYDGRFSDIKSLIKAAKENLTKSQ